MSAPVKFLQYAHYMSIITKVLAQNPLKDRNSGRTNDRCHRILPMKYNLETVEQACRRKVKDNAAIAMPVDHSSASLYLCRRIYYPNKSQNCWAISSQYIRGLLLSIRIMEPDDKNCFSKKLCSPEYAFELVVWTEFAQWESHGPNHCRGCWIVASL